MRYTKPVIPRVEASLYKTIDLFGAKKEKKASDLAEYIPEEKCEHCKKKICKCN